MSKTEMTENQKQIFKSIKKENEKYVKYMSDCPDFADCSKMNCSECKMLSIPCLFQALLKDKNEKLMNLLLPEGFVLVKKEEQEGYTEKRARIKAITDVAHYLDDEKGFCGLGYLTAKHFGVDVLKEEK